MNEAEARHEHIVQVLQTFMAPGQWTEVRALHLQGKRAVHAFFCLEQAEAAARQALQWDRLGARAVYFVPSPLRADIASGRGFARADDALAIHWLMVDCEFREGHGSQPATDQEKAAAWAVADRVKATLEAGGLSGCKVADSGNGWHLLYPVRLPASEGKGLAKEALSALEARCSDEVARVDPSTYQPHQATKLYGTTARRGEESEGRPWRTSWLLEGLGLPPTEEEAQSNTQALLRLIAAWRKQDDLRRGPERQRIDDRQREHQRQELWARAALRSEAEKLASTPEGGHAGGNNREKQLYASAAAMGNLVAGGLLSRLEVERTLDQAAHHCGLDKDPNVGQRGIDDRLRRGIDEGMKSPRVAPPSDGCLTGPVIQGTLADGAAPAPDQDAPKRRTARLADLARAGACVEWLWPGWIQRGVLTAIAAEGGRGKTRFCADLVRRIRHGLPWPDGSPMTVESNSQVLWVVADNHHDEMVSLGRSFDIEDAVAINAWDTDPYGGVTLDEPDDVRDLGARIEEVKPVLVVVDTVGNATDRNLSKQEDAKAFYQPLQVLARRYRCAILCLTHLNASGAFLGRRVMEKVRTAIRIEQPDPNDPKRRIEVKKSNSKVPPALGLVMGDNGNEYDTQPPVPAEDGGVSNKRGPAPARLEAATQWLAAHLELGAKPVGITRSEAEKAGFDAKLLYRARDLLGVAESTSQGRKYWELPPNKEDF